MQLSRIIFTVLISLISFSAFSQSDTLIKNSYYECKYSLKKKHPIYVSYILYRGGGTCNRSKYHFIQSANIPTPNNNDYIGSGYDIGHLCPAEDFAYNCDAVKSTFFYYNTVPQTPHLNRGVWKSFEIKIRKLSETDSLLIITGGYYSSSITLNDEYKIPSYCWKVVQSVKTGEILYCFWCVNHFNNDVVKHMKLEQLEKKLGFKLNIRDDK